MKETAVFSGNGLLTLDGLIGHGGDLVALDADVAHRSAPTELHDEATGPQADLTSRVRPGLPPAASSPHRG